MMAERQLQRAAAGNEALRPFEGRSDLHAWRLITRTADYWSDAISACRRARRRIAVEQYILSYDRAGRRLAAVLSEKAREGIQVRLLLDAFGSRHVLDSATCRALRDAGAQTVTYNSFWRPPFFPDLKNRLRRDHRKIVMADDAAYVGSACVDAEMRDWIDFTVRLEGPVVDDIVSEFDAAWDNPQVAGDEAPLASRRRPDFRFTGNWPGGGQTVYQRLLQRIARARREVIFCSPFMLPDRRFLCALAAARRRGVGVTFIGPRKTDSPYVDAVGWMYYGKLLRLGCRLLLYKPAVLHAKAAAVDGSWATVGSTNIDRLSFYINREGNVESSDPGFAAAVTTALKTLGDASEDLTVERVRERPWQKKLMGVIARPFSPVL